MSLSIIPGRVLREIINLKSCPSRWRRPTWNLIETDFTKIRIIRFERIRTNSKKIIRKLRIRTRPLTTAGATPLRGIKSIRVFFFFCSG